MSHRPNILRRARWETALACQRARRHLRPVPALDRLPLGLWARLAAPDAAAVVAELGRRVGRATFVQVGSHDGVSNDPLFETVRRHRWRGVLVEPMPEPFARLRANYAAALGLDGLAFENAAVGRSEGTIELFVARRADGDPPWVSQLASSDRQVLLRHADELADLDRRVSAVRVPSVRLPTLVARHRLERIDVLHVDAEGADLSVLEQIDLGAAWAPAAIVFEKKHLDPGQYRRTYRAFRRSGYRRVALWPDELWYRRREVAAR